MIMAKHNKNINPEEFEQRMLSARGLTSSEKIDKNIKEERRKQRLLKWEERLYPTYRNLKLKPKLFKYILNNRKQKPIRFVADSIDKRIDTYKKKSMVFSLAKCFIYLGYSNTDVEIIDYNYFINSVMDWDEKNKFFSQLENPNLKLLIITDFDLSDDSNISYKKSDIEMFWSRFETLLSDNPKLDVLMTFSDSFSQKRVALEKSKEDTISGTTKKESPKYNRLKSFNFTFLDSPRRKEESETDKQKETTDSEDNSKSGEDFQKALNAFQDNWK